MFHEMCIFSTSLTSLKLTRVSLCYIRVYLTVYFLLSREGHECLVKKMSFRKGTSNDHSQWGWGWEPGEGCAVHRDESWVSVAFGARGEAAVYRVPGAGMNFSQGRDWHERWVVRTATVWHRGGEISTS